MTGGGAPIKCRRCLLEEAGERELSEIIGERVSLIPPKQRTPSKLYERRLEICGECENLNQGTCIKCGCYVELRAARIDSQCPDIKHYW